ncbi:MAG: flagellar hook-associated protein FlgK [Actinomycetota bacterium]|nr:flagellar hook-associated protein FlgK [Actinomycetota bacterium]
MSTFGALNTAFSGLTAARQGLSVVGQNIANANTAGYTRQRVTTSAINASVGLFTGIARPGQGVSIDGVARLGDAFLDARVRSTTADAGYTSVRASALGSIEDGTHEPGTDGISAKLQSFWTGWAAMSNHAGDPASAQVLLASANTLTGQISGGYSDLETQWSQTRTQANGMVTNLNNAAAQVAGLNATIRSTVAAGGDANELIDQRNVLTTTISSLAGGTVKDAGDGTVDVYVGGNALVSGSTANAVKLAGSDSLNALVSGGGSVQLTWAGGSGQAVALDGGQLAGALSVLAPSNSADGAGTGGAIAEAAQSYNALATTLASVVNTQHTAGFTSAGTAAGNFFNLAASGPAAKGLTVAVTDVSGLATGAAGKGNLDGSNADAMSQLGTATGSPDSVWATFVTRTGSASQAEQQHSKLADAAATSATSMQASGASVSLDEESMNLLTYQHAYQAAARVMTAVDDMLDTLINKTGLVGR